MTAHRLRGKIKLKLPTIDKCKPAVILSLRISSDTVRKVDEVAKEKKTTRSIFLRDAISKALPEVKDGENS